MIHLGKHGNLEWLPGKNAGLSAACGPDAALGDLPLVYPFLVNDPGEGTQAKRRAHATLVDHLVPPMARAESYGDIARLEQLLDEHAKIAAMDPAKLPAIRGQIWTLIQAAKLDHDLGLDDRPDDERLRRLHHAHRRLALRDQGRPDPRRAARARSGPGGRGPGQPRPRDAARPADLGRHRARSPGCARRSASTSRRATAAVRPPIEAVARELVATLDHGDWTDADRGHGGRRRCRPRDSAVDGPPSPGLRRPRGRAAARRDHRGARPRGARAARRLRAGRARPARRCAAWSTSCRPAATSTPSTPRRPQPAGLGDRPGPRRLAAGALPRRHRRVAALGRPVAVGHAARCAPPATTSPRSLPCWASARSGTTPRAGSPAWSRSRSRSWAARGSTSRCGSPASSATRSRTSSRCSTTPCGWPPASTSRETDNYVRAHAQADLASTATSGGRPPASSAPGRARTAPACSSCIDSRDWRTDADLAEVYTVWGGYAYGRDARRPPARDGDGDGVQADRGGGEEHRHPRARHRRLRRLLPVPRRHGRDRARADRHRARRRTSATRPGPRPCAPAPWSRRRRGSSARAWSTRAGSRRCAATATRARSSWPRRSTTSSATTPPPAWSRTGCTSKLTETYVLDAENRAFLEEANPWALHGMAERLLEASGRGLWAQPPEDMVAALTEVLLETEGQIEGRATESREARARDRVRDQGSRS